jgi:hypothetical protein
MISLDGFDLRSNFLTGTLPTEYGVLTKLRLDLRNNNLNGPIPGVWSSLATGGDLSDNNMLCRLDAASTAVAAAVSAGGTDECACTDLAVCPSGATKSSSAANNAATPFYPAEDTTCCPVGTSLLEKLVTDNHLDCTVGRPCVATTGTSGKGVLATAVDLSGQSLTGTIPPEISTLTAVTALGLLNNILTGTMPSDIGAMTALNVLILNNNKLTGSVPPEFGELTGLTRLFLYKNELVGSIPPELSALTSMTQIGMSNNLLTGSIPPGLGELTAVKLASFNNNKLTGTIPVFTQIGALDALLILRLEKNLLSGAIPGVLVFLTKLTSFRIDDNFDLCRLNAASTAVTTFRCTTACPFPVCACTDLSGCPTDNPKTSSTVVNPATPFYPADDTTCCPLGASLLENLVTDNHLDCTGGRPCVVTTSTPGKGMLATSVKLTGQGLTGTIPPELGQMTALTKM